MTITAIDPSGNVSTAVVTVIIRQEIITISNKPPLADCGADITAQAIVDCSGSVTLNGTASSDSDGTIVSYLWTLPGGGTVSGSIAVVSLSTGTHEISLTVTDDDGAVDVDTVMVTIIDVMPPVIAAVTDMAVANDAGVCGAAVSFTTSATDNCDVASVVSTPASGTVFPVGTTTVTTVATDSSGNSSSSTFTVTVDDVEAGECC